MECITSFLMKVQKGSTIDFLKKPRCDAKCFDSIPRLHAAFSCRGSVLFHLSKTRDNQEHTNRSRYCLIHFSRITYHSLAPFVSLWSTLRSEPLRNSQSPERIREMPLALHPGSCVSLNQGPMKKLCEMNGVGTHVQACCRTGRRRTEAAWCGVCPAPRLSLLPPPSLLRRLQAAPSLSITAKRTDVL